MKYTKPVILAQNTKEQSFATGCPENIGGTGVDNDYARRICKQCERSV